MGILEDLGFDRDDRVAVVHIDDIGMCSAANAGASAALADAATCGSVMVPCPGFPEIARLARDNPHWDLGVHLTLNCEYEDYRWGPLASEAASLRAPDGGMWPSVDETVEHASVEDVELELRTQVQTAIEAGIDVTHLDSHMGSIFHPKFIEAYFRLALELRLPVFVPRVTQEVLERAGMPLSLERYVEIIDRAEGMGFPIFDAYDGDSLGYEPGSEVEYNRARAQELGPGLNYLITHCAVGDDELQSLTPDWRQRDGEYRIYSDGTMTRCFEELGIKTLGMLPLRERLQGMLSA